MNEPSRSEKKRQYKQIEAAARECAVLSDNELARLPVDETVVEEIRICRTVKGGALKRQLKYVTKLMQYEQLDQVFTFLSQLKGSKLEENRFQHEAEKLRDAVVTDALQAWQESRQFDEPWPIDWPSEPIEDVVQRYPDIDEQELRSSAHQYARSRNKGHYREIFRIIRAAADKQRLSQR
jgi:ribosome-associated protein